MGSKCVKHKKHFNCENKPENNMDHHMLNFERHNKLYDHEYKCAISSPRRLETYIFQFFKCHKCGQKFNYYNLLKLHYFVEHIEKK